jgi:hypothetical protein
MAARRKIQIPQAFKVIKHLMAADRTQVDTNFRADGAAVLARPRK